MTYFRKTYIRLGQRVSPHDQQILERAIRNVLATIPPTECFVSELERELIAEAQHQQQDRAHLGQWLRVAGFIGGGLLSIAGGVWMWSRWQQRRPHPDTATAPHWSLPRLNRVQRST